MTLEQLDEKGFVFIDENNRPFWCRMYGGRPWFMRWHEGQKSWVTLKPVNQMDVWMAHEKKISDEQAELYHKKHEEFIGMG
jgi:hypothetical protein